jgi:dihydrofolate reductase
MGATIVVSYDKKFRVIGDRGMLPWPPNQEDHWHFTETTLGHTVLMGSNTWQSLSEQPSLRNLSPVHLPNRKNIIISRRHDDLTVEMHKQIGDLPIFFTSLRQAIANAKLMSPDDCFVIGGGYIFRQFLSTGAVDRIIASEIDQQYEGDTFFPAINTPQRWLGNAKTTSCDNTIWKIASTKQKQGFKIVEYIK